ncbi:hypothetical protein AR000_07735 [Listeria monocytogenes]|nr:hypothetical protein [Listeria monocytogenes]EAD0294503.1 hypothetical protein [Listeria monocytogenes]EAD1139504.1 hypothetical protein [Listeria monocytogenes]EAD1148719.1 hypothetical protein [Listeria monocytogenes]
MKQKRENNLTRKYFTEFGLNMVADAVQYLFPTELDLIPTNGSSDHYHIYMINRITKVRFSMNSLVQHKDYFTVRLEIKKPNTGLIVSNPIAFSLDSFDKNNIDSILIDSSRKFVRITLKNDATIQINSLFFLTHSQQFTKIDMDIIYIGQSYGNQGNRNATKRLKSHETLQRILSVSHDEEWNNDICITIWNFKELTLFSFDGTSNNLQKNMDEDSKHIDKVLNEPIKKRKIINITEAALINYFKPKFNEKFVNEFPSESHTSYNDFYTSEYNTIIIEFFYENNINFMSENNILDGFAPSIKFKLDNQSQSIFPFPY